MMHKRLVADFHGLGRVLAILLLCSPAAYAGQTNFNYTTVSGGLLRVRYYDRTCAGTGTGLVCYSTLFGAGAAGSYQLLDGPLVLSGSFAVATNSAFGTSLTAASSSIGLNVVEGIGSRVDVSLGVASLGSQVEGCLGSTCSKDYSASVGYMVGIRSWLGEGHRFAASLAAATTPYTDSSGTSTTTVSTEIAGAYYVTKNHEITLGYSSNSYASQFGATYRYHFGR